MGGHIDMDYFGLAHSHIYLLQLIVLSNLEVP